MPWVRSWVKSAEVALPLLLPPLDETGGVGVGGVVPPPPPPPPPEDGGGVGVGGVVPPPPEGAGLG